MPDQTLKKKKKNCIELNFMEIEFQNATIGLPQPAMGQSHLGKKNFARKRRYRALKCHYRA